MEKIQYRFVFNRKKQLNEKGEALVQLEALLNRKKAYFSMHIHLPLHSWNKKKEIVINHPQADILNAMLYEERNRVEALELAEWKRSGDMSIPTLRKLVRGNVLVGDFISFAKDVIHSSNRSKGTKGNLMTTLKRLQKFRKSIEFKDITYTFIREFEQHLCQEHTNTTAKHLKNLRTLVNAAINEGYMKADEYPFRKFRIKTIEPKHSVLTPEELAMIEQLGKSEIVDAFLFCCYTGMRFSDFTHLQPDNIIPIAGKQWLIYRTRKTDIEIKLPLYLLFGGKALDILSRRDITNLTNIGSNAEANAKLRKALPECGKKVTWHTARHTFATVLLHFGTPITSVQKMLGHTDIKTTMIYSEVTAAAIVQDLQITDKRMK